MTAPRRIGVLTTSFPRSEEDSAGAFVLGFCRALADRGHDIEVLAPEPAHGEAPTFEGVRLRWVRYLPRPLEHTFYGAGVPDNVRRDPRAVLGVVPFPIALLRQARQAAHDWDAIASHWAIPCGLVGGAVASDRPHLTVFHSADLHLLSKLPGRRLIAGRLGARSTALLFVTTGARDRFLSWLSPVPRLEVAGRCHVCPMGIAPPDPLPSGKRSLREELGLHRRTVVSLGRLVPIKGVDLAIDAIAGRDDAELIVAGDGPERETLRARARALGANVRFVGPVHGSAKWKLLAAADAFVAPSRTTGTGRAEGVPTAVLEAMYASLPVVVADTGGLPSLVTHDVDGLVVGGEDQNALRGAIDRLLADRNLRRRLGRRAHTTAAGYRWTELAPHLERLLSPDG